MGATLMDQQILDAMKFYAASESYASYPHGPDVMKDQGQKAREAVVVIENAPVDQQSERSSAVESTLREILDTMPIPAPYQAGRPAYERARQLLGMDRGDR